jgi:acetyltransferase-like isoleucine patch superfamily enzyme
LIASTRSALLELFNNLNGSKYNNSDTTPITPSRSSAINRVSPGISISNNNNPITPYPYQSTYTRSGSNTLLVNNVFVDKSVVINSSNNAKVRKTPVFTPRCLIKAYS